MEPTRSTQLSRPGGGAPDALELDVWTLPRDSPARSSLAYLSWNVLVAPAEASVPASEVLGVALSATNFDLDSTPVLAALRAANMM